VRGALRIARGPQISQGEVLPPTIGGWQRFVTLAPASGIKFAEIEEAGAYWWDRKIPRNLLSASRDDTAVAAK
jgi:hypothetical protein